MSTDRRIVELAVKANEALLAHGFDSLEHRCAIDALSTATGSVCRTCFNSRIIETLEKKDEDRCEIVLVWCPSCTPRTK